MPVTHKKVSGNTPGGDTSLVRRDDWNANHQSPRFLIYQLGRQTTGSWSSMPSALTEFRGNAHMRTRVDLSKATNAYFSLRVATAGASGSRLRVQYSTDESTWNYLDHSTGPEIDIGSTGWKSASVALHSSAKVDNAYLRIVGLNGNGSTSPAFGHIALEVD